MKKKKNLHKMIIASQRNEQIAAGFFDGRFVQRSEKSKKIYSRKSKHRNDVCV
jgi:hypothetical protein